MYLRLFADVTLVVVVIVHLNVHTQAGPGGKPNEGEIGRKDDEFRFAVKEVEILPLGTFIALVLAQIFGNVNGHVVSEVVLGRETLLAHFAGELVRIHVQLGMLHQFATLIERSIATGQQTIPLMHLSIVQHQILECSRQVTAVDARQIDCLSD